MDWLATAALEFCRECLGWKDAKFGYETLYDGWGQHTLKNRFALSVRLK